MIRIPEGSVLPSRTACQKIIADYQGVNIVEQPKPSVFFFLPYNRASTVFIPLGMLGLTLDHDENKYSRLYTVTMGVNSRGLLMI